MDDTGRFAVAAVEQGVEPLLGERAAGLIAEWVMTEFAQRLAPIFNERAESILGGAIADEALIVLDLDIVALDLGRRQRGGAMGGECWNDGTLVCHRSTP